LSNFEECTMARLAQYPADFVRQILLDSEGGAHDGHTLSRHVNITNADLVRRVFRTRGGAIANYGAFRAGNIADATFAIQALLNSPDGQTALGELDVAVDLEKARHPGRPLTEEEADRAFRARTIRGPAQGGLRMRWVQAGSMVVEVPAAEIFLHIEAVPGGTFVIVTCYPIFGTCAPHEMRVIQRFDPSKL
jgi:hypothetical protein